MARKSSTRKRRPDKPKPVVAPVKPKKHRSKSAAAAHKHKHKKRKQKRPLQQQQQQLVYIYPGIVQPAGFIPLKQKLDAAGGAPVEAPKAVSKPKTPVVLVKQREPDRPREQIVIPIQSVQQPIPLRARYAERERIPLAAGVEPIRYKQASPQRIYNAAARRQNTVVYEYPNYAPIYANPLPQLVYAEPVFGDSLTAALKRQDSEMVKNKEKILQAALQRQKASAPFTPSTLFLQTPQAPKKPPKTPPKLGGQPKTPESALKRFKNWISAKKKLDFTKLEESPPSSAASEKDVLLNEEEQRVFDEVTAEIPPSGSPPKPHTAEFYDLIYDGIVHKYNDIRDQYPENARLLLEKAIEMFHTYTTDPLNAGIRTHILDLANLLELFQPVYKSRTRTPSPSLTFTADTALSSQQIIDKYDAFRRAMIKVYENGNFSKFSEMLNRLRNQYENKTVFVGQKDLQYIRIKMRLIIQELEKLEKNIPVNPFDTSSPSYYKKRKRTLVDSFKKNYSSLIDSIESLPAGPKLVTPFKSLRKKSKKKVSTVVVNNPISVDNFNYLSHMKTLEAPYLSFPYGHKAKLLKLLKETYDPVLKKMAQTELDILEEKRLRKQTPSKKRITRPFVVRTVSDMRSPDKPGSISLPDKPVKRQRTSTN